MVRAVKIGGLLTANGALYHGLIWHGKYMPKVAIVGP